MKKTRLVTRLMKKIQTGNSRFCKMGLALFLAALAPSLYAQDETLWNVMWIMTDMHNVHTIGADSQVTTNTCQTPAMDRLAAEGVYFNNAYDAYPVCAPTRQAIITGEFPQVHGQLGNSVVFENGGPASAHPSLMHHFKANGYNTALMGKTHSNNQDANSNPSDNQHFLGFDYVVQRGGTNDGVQRMRYHELRRRYASYPNDDGGGTGKQQWEKDMELNMHKRTRFNSIDHPAKNSDGIYGYDVLNYLDAYSTETNTDEYKCNPENPFFVYLSFHKPHVDYVAPTGQDGEKFYSKYIGHLSLDQYGTVPVDMPADMPGLNDYEMKYPYPAADSKRKDWINMTDAEIRLARARYYACVNWIDHLIDNVLDKLDELDDPRNPGKKLSETTIVIYTSDHGDMMGEKTLFLKNQMYEGSARVPFIVRMPDVIPAGSRSDILMSHVDMIPTLAGLAGCGAGVDDNIFGRNYAEAILANDPALGPERIFSLDAIAAPDVHPGQLMSRSQNFKFIRHRDNGSDDRHSPVLFDMVNDPMETTNLAYDINYGHIVNRENEAMDNFLAQFGVKPLKIVVPQNQ